MSTHGFLVIMSGLPGVGKTTLAMRLASALTAVYLRADTMEQALRDSGISKVGGAGYAVGYALASENLKLGRIVVADSVNPWHLTREAWRDAARRAGSEFLDVEVVCSDVDEHRRRVESRVCDIPGHVLPDWNAVMGRDYVPFDLSAQGKYLRVDTAVMGVEEAVSLIVGELALVRGRCSVVE